MRVAFIGSVGIPNCYGGFESFLESVTPVLVSNDINVVVTCDRSRYEDNSDSYLGVTRVMVNVRANGPLSPLHDLLAFIAVFKKSNFIVVLGVSAGPIFLLMRLFTFIFGKQLIINLDGVEWRRGKYKAWQKILLYFFDLFAQYSANTIVYDNKGLTKFIHKIFLKKSVLIAYPGDAVIRIADIRQEPGTALTICRIEPENNLEILIKGALCSKLSRYTIIGNWQNSSYGKALKKKYSHHPLLELLDPIYDPNEIAKFRTRTAIYLHGHSVGGTNPSLVEMLSYSCYILCFDCIFNRETAGEDSIYFDGEGDLAKKINLIMGETRVSSRVLQNKYKSSYIADQYIQLLRNPR